MQCYVDIPPHLTYVATLPCETCMCEIVKGCMHVKYVKRWFCMWNVCMWEGVYMHQTCVCGTQCIYTLSHIHVSHTKTIPSHAYIASHTYTLSHTHVSHTKPSFHTHTLLHIHYTHLPHAWFKIFTVTQPSTTEMIQCNKYSNQLPTASILNNSNKPTKFNMDKSYKYINKYITRYTILYDRSTFTFGDQANPK